MGKTRSGKDRGFVTSKDFREFGYGGKTAQVESKQRAALPFDRCNISLVPFKHPVCTPDGWVFDIENITPHVTAHHTNPCTNRPLQAKDLIKLHFHRNTDGKYCCPVTYKIFNENTHIVAIRTSGNVYAYDAVDELNIKRKSWIDLVSGEPFKRDDIITLQDPNNPHLRSVEQPTTTTSSKKRKTPPPPPPSLSSASSDANVPRSRHTTHHYTASFTSTALTPQTTNTRAVLTPTQQRAQWHAHIKTLKPADAKAYIRIHTSDGDVNVVVHCDLVPRISHNFIELCKRGAYDNTVFHRLIPGFMIQGGDPSGSGRGGTSAWGDEEPTIEDEFHHSLRHDDRGILAMANSGKNTNRAQFYITFAACAWLDDKHCVFGKVVGGMDVLSKLEAHKTYKNGEQKDRPLDEVKILSTTVLRSPFDQPFQVRDELELDREMKRRHAKRVAFSKGEITQRQFDADNDDDDDGVDDEKGEWFSKGSSSSSTTTTTTTASGGVGKYLKLPPPTTKKPSTTLNKNPAKKKQGYGNFDNW